MVPIMLPLDRTRVEELKICGFSAHLQVKILDDVPQTLISHYVVLDAYPERSCYGGPSHEC
jgi:hypothetical protein